MNQKKRATLKKCQRALHSYRMNVSYAVDNVLVRLGFLLRILFLLLPLDMPSFFQIMFLVVFAVYKFLFATIV